MAVEESFDSCEEMKACFAAVDAVVPVGVSLEFKLDTRLNKLFGKFGGVLEVDIVVGETMADEQVAVQSLVAMER